MINKIVVSDTTAITHLARIGALNILHQLYSVIYIPEAVYKELTSHGAKIPGSYEVQSYPWIRKLALADKTLAISLKKRLDDGESEAISLAKEINADLLIIDEKAGRQQAKELGIRIVGVVGVLLSAKDKGIITHVKPYLEHLTNTGFKLGSGVIEMALEVAGEKSLPKKA